VTALLLAVEVGATTVRAGAFDEFGRLAASAVEPLDAMHPRDGQQTYRMDAIWHAMGLTVRVCLAARPDLGMRVVGIGFTAVSALVLDCDGVPPFEGGADVFGAMDRRAAAEAAEIGATGDRWLDHRGGALAPGSHLARLLWLKRSTPAAWSRLRTARHLCDELARRATGIEAHSAGALATELPYLVQDDDPWRHELLATLGLGDIRSLGALAGDPLPAGTSHGTLQPVLAELLGLPPGIPVAAGLPCAHAGLLGAIGRGLASRIDRTATLVGGDTTSLLALSAEPRLLPGIDGPFRDVPFPGLWLHEAGQACSGAALDAVLAHHPGGPMLAGADAHAATAAEILDLLDREGAAFAASRHVVPDFLGNRTPLNGPGLAALATGLADEGGSRAFLETYYATARGLALQLRQIILHLNAGGFRIDRVALSGAHARNPLLVRLYRDALGAGLVVCDTREPVLLGAAMAAATAAGIHPSLAFAVELMSPPQVRLDPDPFWRRAHDAAFDIYLRLFAARNDAACDSAALAALSR
jgi:FGGY-family pentulose kinase